MFSYETKKMIRLIKHKKSFFTENKKATLVVLGLLLLLVVITGIFGAITGSIFTPFARLGGLFYQNGSFLPGLLTDKQRLLEENSKLRNEIERLSLSLSDFEAVIAENEMLRRELGIKPEGNFISAVIVARPPQIPFDTILIDRGSADGVKVGDLVFASRKNAIGRIEKVQKGSSVVLLYSKAGLSQSAFISRTNMLIQIEGGGGGSILARTPIDLDIIVGDVISADSLGANIAVVESVEEDKVLGIKNVIMSLSANPSVLRMVFLVNSESPLK